MSGLAEELLGRETGSGAVLRDGIVSAVSPLTIIVPPSTVASPAAKLDSYVPAVGDFVQVLVQGANRLVIGSVGRTTAWTALTLLNSWVNFGGSQQTAQYRKVGDVVQVRGLVKSGAANTVAFNLPAGFRPPADLEFPIVGAAAAAFAAVGVLVGGNVTIFTAGATTDIAINFSFSTTA